LEYAGSDQLLEALQRIDVRRQLDLAEAVLEIGSALDGKREGDGLAGLGRRGAAAMLRDEVLQVIHYGQFLGRNLAADDLAQGIVGCGSQVGVVAGGVDRGEDAEQSPAGVQLARLLGGRARTERQNRGEGEKENDSIQEDPTPHFNQLQSIVQVTTSGRG
jgi:hypothetical protein